MFSAQASVPSNLYTMLVALFCLGRSIAFVATMRELSPRIAMIRAIRRDVMYATRCSVFRDRRQRDDEHKILEAEEDIQPTTESGHVSLGGPRKALQLYTSVASVVSVTLYEYDNSFLSR